MLAIGTFSAATTAAPTTTAAAFLGISGRRVRQRHTGCDDRRVDELGNQCGFVARFTCFTWLTRFARFARTLRIARFTRLALRREIRVAPVVASRAALRLSRAWLRPTCADRRVIVAALVATAAASDAPPRSLAWCVAARRSRSSPLRLSRRPSRLRSEGRSSRASGRCHRRRFGSARNHSSTRESHDPRHPRPRRS